ncbi:phage integrase SAM-like domain-containing protein, partial [Enterobacter hormaechei]
MWFVFQEFKTLVVFLKITSFDIEEYNYFLVRKGLSVSTQFNYTMPIKQLYNYFYQRGLIAKSLYLLKYKIRNKKETKFLNTQVGGQAV